MLKFSFLVFSHSEATAEESAQLKLFERKAGNFNVFRHAELDSASVRNSAVIYFLSLSTNHYLKTLN